MLADFGTTASPLGNMRDARAAVNRELPLVGSGAYRNVYADSKGRFVYKVEKYPEGINEHEHDMAEMARANGIPGVPRTHLWRVLTKQDDGTDREWLVLCMRKYPSPSDESYSACNQKGYVDAWLSHGFKDLHSHNMTLTPGGRPRILDMGGYGG